MKTEKQLNALIYAIEKYPRIGRTKLMKFVFLSIYSDLTRPVRHFLKMNTSAFQMVRYWMSVFPIRTIQMRT